MDHAARPVAVDERGATRQATSGLWGRAFRPFFLGLASYATVTVPLWIAMWLGAVTPPAWLAPSLWHGHEMVFGVVAAAIAGFLLTASPVWSGGPILQGRPLAWLVALWLAGRLAFLAAGQIPAGWIAAIDLAFLPAVAGAVVRTLWGSGQLRNYGVVGIVVCLAIANTAMHVQAVLGVPDLAGRALRFAVDFVVVLILVIGGRITPAFTRNAFRRDGIDREVRAWRWPGALAIGAAVGLALVTVVFGRSPATGVLAWVAGLAAAVRVLGWQSWHTRRDPLLWSLHAGSAWAVVGLALVGASDLGLAVPRTSGLHALTSGAMGSIILAVMVRVGLGHTGRPLTMPAGVVWCFPLVYLGATIRVVTPFATPGLQPGLLLLAGVSWAAAFALFAARFAGILVAPRFDGRPG